jgi:predicted nucleic acid-binding protein
LSGYLLDTSAISMFSPWKANVSSAFSDWMDEQKKADSIYLSTVTIHEIGKGVRLLEHKGAIAKANSIHLWLQGLVSVYGNNILPLDTDVAMESGKLEALAVASGYRPRAADAIIAGTAKFHEMTIITHNLKHFLPFEIAVESPDRIGL